MQTFISVIHVISCLLIVLVVLLQSGKGAEISASFGGSSQTIFGSSGGANFFTRFTAVLAAIFFVTSILLTLIAGRNNISTFEKNPIQRSAAPQSTTAPASLPGAADPAKPETQSKTAESPSTSSAVIPPGKGSPAAAEGQPEKDKGKKPAN